MQHVQRPWAGLSGEREAGLGGGQRTCEQCVEYGWRGHQEPGTQSLTGCIKDSGLKISRNPFSAGQ